ncbi:MAG: hypothetical protein WBG86_09585 [Polyangiales bacterium]
MHYWIACLVLMMGLSVAASAQEAGDAATAPTGPGEAYGVRYAKRKLVMPRGMIRGTFDVVVGDIDGARTTTINLGVAVAPANHIEFGISRYRMGSFPNPDVLRAFGGDGLVPIIAQGADLIPLGATNERRFGDLLAYMRAEAVAGSIASIAFDLGFLLPTASELGLFIGLPMRFHGGDVFAFDTGIQVNVDNLGGDGGGVTSIALPWNAVFNATDALFIMVNSGLNAADVGGGGGALKTFPFGFGAGYTVVGPRTMADVFALFSWPVFGIIDPGDVVTDVWTVTIGVNFYSPVLFGSKQDKRRADRRPRGSIAPK